MISQERFDC